MKSGLKDRNNSRNPLRPTTRAHYVSMKSGLKDRNNNTSKTKFFPRKHCLNEVRPERPEQSMNDET